MLKMKGMRFPKEIILVCIQWYAAYALSYRNLEEMMQERGVSVDHSTVNRWAIRFLPVLEKIFRRQKRPVGGSWRMDETYIKVCGQWKYLYRAVDKEGKTIDFLLRAKRDKAAATLFVKIVVTLVKLPFLMNYPLVFPCSTRRSRVFPSCEFCQTSVPACWFWPAHKAPGEPAGWPDLPRCGAVLG